MKLSVRVFLHEKHVGCRECGKAECVNIPHSRPERRRVVIPVIEGLLPVEIVVSSEQVAKRRGLGLGEGLVAIEMIHPVDGLCLRWPIHGRERRKGKDKNEGRG